jgi:hypothetical protein
MGKESVNVGVIGCLMFDGVAGSVGESRAKKLGFWLSAISVPSAVPFLFDWPHLWPHFATAYGLALDTEAQPGWLLRCRYVASAFSNPRSYLLVGRGYLGSLFELADMHVTDHVTERGPHCRYLLRPSSPLDSSSQSLLFIYSMPARRLS